MDPVSHAALGASLGALTAGRGRIRGVMPAAIAGSLLPDVDAVAMPFGWDRYLRVHEIGTHSLVGSLAVALGVALGIALVVRRDVAPWQVNGPGARGWRLVLLAAWLGSATHVLLDLISSARIRVLWPVVDRQFSIPLVAMADPYLAAVLALAIPSLWLPVRVRRLAISTVLCFAVFFLGVKAVRARAAVERYLEAAARPDSYFVEAGWASLQDWQAFDRRDNVIRQWRSDASSVELVATWPVLPETPVETSSRTLATVRNFLHVHQLAFPVTVKRAEGTTVLWSDPRFCWRPSRGGRTIEPTIIRADGALACAVWAGGEFDPNGTALRQVVHVFGFTQTRTVSE